MVTGWRIAKSQYSKTAMEMLSGTGAFLYGGRWNNPGTSVVYLGSSIAQAAMELLVHLKNTDLLKTYNIMSVSFDESCLQVVDTDTLPSDWAAPTMTSSVRDYGDEWANSLDSLALQVPSAAVFGESNYLLNCEHHDMQHIECGPIQAFRYDPRLVKQ